MYYPAFDGMFNPLPAPDVCAVLPRFRGLLASILAQGWPSASVHLFGWQHGGALALELAYSLGRDPLTPPSSASGASATGSSASSTAAPGTAAPGTGAVSRLGSVTSVCAHMASHPDRAVHYATPCCFFTRDGPAQASTQAAERDVERAFTPTVIVRAEAGRGPDMPRSTDEWTGIMRFWGQVMDKPVAQGMEGVYEVK